MRVGTFVVEHAMISFVVEHAMNSFAVHDMH